MINQDNITNFTNLSDEEIRQRISDAAAEGKISPARLKSALSDIGKVKTMISKMKPEDIERMLRIIGRENAEKMAEKLKGDS